MQQAVAGIPDINLAGDAGGIHLIGIGCRCIREDDPACGPIYRVNRLESGLKMPRCHIVSENYA
ncbi:hypothetical protein TH5_14510 [Thalassospira xianhensis MCCC 1A02616]|uniref:Uncharacterized protein n=1 Tax=Thalassospira xianhensis MCCC 1A02616 TaxID=1177929 RepID=A0A367UAY5_9PROT|nr:hypothetical protein TH5_14510 [Thalassospira xianhensis MCCC 1A02616]